MLRASLSEMSGLCRLFRLVHALFKSLRLCRFVYITFVGERAFNVFAFTSCSLLFSALSASWRRVAEWHWALVVWRLDVGLPCVCLRACADGLWTVCEYAICAGGSFRLYLLHILYILHLLRLFYLSLLLYD